MAKRVLIADPDNAVAISLEFILQRAGYKVLLARCDDDLSERVAGDAPDVVVLADRQADGDGFDLCRTLSGSALAPPILMITSQARETNGARGREVGAADVLSEPFPSLEFLRRVKRLATEAA